ncbi:kanamycin nucleotidyltransferase C-terminal domain-containing protein [Paenibacillus sp. Marseille-Q4541]|uniref:kanamycin nucleotidyltransferase C-terminal domain-containing protein n=1 Tax=Paenibacillus sp. Marseille-Q4541 TaxID=2831522 RepID=UPI001BAA65BA|nr:kanamycin nucleotidyltransferase C-terminal domain-containing protein [Paenibacillus sp. Marseille-Q4541]
MLPFPAETSRKEKLDFINEIKNKLLDKYDEDIEAIGIYGSVAQEKEGPYSDIELHVISRDGSSMPSRELICHPFKLEISTKQKSEWLDQASTVDDGWAIKMGSFIHITSLYDPNGIFNKAKEVSLSVPEEAFREVIAEFMVWEPYETMGKIRNARISNNLSYLPRAVFDFTWQIAKLIGLLNKQYYTSRSVTLEESIEKPIKPEGYAELAKKVISGELSDKEELYLLCENLWFGLNNLLEELGIEYRSDILEL